MKSFNHIAKQIESQIETIIGVISYSEKMILEIGLENWEKKEYKMVIDSSKEELIELNKSLEIAKSI